MGVPALHFGTIRHFPQADRVVFAGGRHHVAVGAPADVGDHAGVTEQIVELLAGRRFPHEQAIRAVARSDEHTIGTEFDGRDPVVVLLVLEQQLTSFGGVDAQHPLGTTESDHRQVGGDVCCENGVIFVADFDLSFAGFYVIDDHFAAGSAASTTHHQQRTIAAELQHLRLSFGEGKHAQHFKRLGVVERDLPMARDRRQWSPGAAGQSGHRVAGRTLHDGIAQVSDRHCDFLGTLAGDFNLGQAGLLLHLGRAARGLQQTAVDPLFDQGEFRFRHLVGVGRHLWFGLVRDEAEQVARAGVTPFDDGARAAALHRARIVIEGQAPLAVIGIVARSAALLEQGQDVIVVRDLLRSRFLGEDGSCEKKNGNREGEVTHDRLRLGAKGQGNILREVGEW